MAAIRTRGILGSSSRILWGGIILLLALPSLGLLYYIMHFGVNTVFADEWDDLVPVIEKWVSGTLSFSDLFAQHNEYRMFFPRIAWLTIQAVTKYNEISEMYFSWLLVSLSGLLLLHVYLKTSPPDNTPKRFLAFLPVSFLLYGFWQYESILWGDGVYQYLIIFSVVATCVLLEFGRKNSVCFGLSFATAIVGSFSAPHGLILWPVGLLQITLSNGKAYLRKTLLWCVVGALTSAIYLYGYVAPVGHPPLDYVLSNPSLGAEYLLTLIGAPFGMSDIRLALALGLVIVLVGVIVGIQSYKGKLLRKNGVWVSLVVFVLLTSLATTVSRSGFGVGQALSSRYTPVTALGIIALYLLAMSTSVNLPDGVLSAEEENKSKGILRLQKLRWRGAKDFGVHALLTLILLGLILSSSMGWQAGQSFKDSREMGAYVLMTYKIQSDENIRKFVYPIPGASPIIKEKARFLEKNELNVFNEPVINVSTLTRINSETYFALDAINEIMISQRTTPLVINSSQQETISIVGWAVDKQANDSASAVFITVDGRTDLATLYGGARQDVANAYHNDRFLFSAFVATFGSSTLSKGEHEIRLKIVSKDKTYFYYPDWRFYVFAA